MQDYRRKDNEELGMMVAAHQIIKRRNDKKVIIEPIPFSKQIEDFALYKVKRVIKGYETMEIT